HVKGATTVTAVNWAASPILVFSTPPDLYLVVPEHRWPAGWSFAGGHLGAQPGGSAQPASKLHRSNPCGTTCLFSAQTSFTLMAANFSNTLLARLYPTMLHRQLRGTGRKTGHAEFSSCGGQSVT